VLDIFERQTLAREHGQPQDVAYAALFLASDESRFINGQLIEVDGGLHSHNPTMPDLMALTRTAPSA
jgi:NAD(P)-dependent dehydrogenase (short-subunit alcohol dehydrogenase family)